jgi:hypothetical protein
VVTIASFLRRPAARPVAPAGSPVEVPAPEEGSRPHDPYSEVRSLVKEQGAIVLETLGPQARRAARVLISGGELRSRTTVDGLTRISGSSTAG